MTGMERNGDIVTLGAYVRQCTAAMQQHCRPRHCSAVCTSMLCCTLPPSAGFQQMLVALCGSGWQAGLSSKGGQGAHFSAHGICL